MLNLIFAILSSASMAVLLRFCEAKSSQKYVVLTMNYLSAVILSGMSMKGDILNPVLYSKLVLLLGVLNGILYLATLLILKMNIRKNGVILSSTFAKLGVIVPTISAVVFFSEIPNGFQIGGILAAACAIVIIHFEKDTGLVSFKTGLIILLICSGCADSLAKVFEYYGEEKSSGHFLFITFTTAFMLCVLLLIIKKQKICLRDIAYGVFIGLPNYLSMYFLLRALTDVPAVAAYPIYSAGTIVIVSLAGMFLFHERLSRRQWGGLGIIIAALILLNI